MWQFEINSIEYCEISHTRKSVISILSVTDAEASVSIKAEYSLAEIRVITPLSVAK